MEQSRELHWARGGALVRTSHHVGSRNGGEDHPSNCILPLQSKSDLNMFWEESLFRNVSVKSLIYSYLLKSYSV